MTKTGPLGRSAIVKWNPATKVLLGVYLKKKHDKISLSCF